jgi:fermentation-respiration switch protein FrsA (DUF1100 family)
MIGMIKPILPKFGLLMRQIIAITLLIISGIILGWSLLTLEQRSIYQPDSTNYPDPWNALAAQPYLAKRVHAIYFNTADGVRLNGWFVKPGPNKPTVVFAHGNGGNQGDRWDVLQAVTKLGYGFLSFDYRGYAKSGGTASESGLYRDLEAATHYLETQGIPSTQQVAMGESLGSAVVIDVAARIPYKAIVVYAALTSTPDVAKQLFNNLNLGFLNTLPWQHLLRQRFDSLSKIARVRAPVLIVHGDKDTMMPLTMPKSLYSKVAHSRKKLIIIPGASHNTTFAFGKEKLLAELEQLNALR